MLSLFIPWHTLKDDFDADFGVDEWHGTNASTATTRAGSSTRTAAQRLVRFGVSASAICSARAACNTFSSKDASAAPAWWAVARQ